MTTKIKILWLIALLVFSYGCMTNSPVKTEPSVTGFKWANILNITDPGRKCHYMLLYLKRNLENYSNVSALKNRMDWNQPKWDWVRQRLWEVEKDLGNYGDYSNAIRDFRNIKTEMDDLIEKKRLSPVVLEISKETCPGDRELDYQARRAQYSGNSLKALELFCRLACSQCLKQDDAIMHDARAYIRDKKKAITTFLHLWSQANSFFGGSISRLFLPLKELEIFQTYYPAWVDQLKTIYPYCFYVPAPEVEFTNGNSKNLITANQKTIREAGAEMDPIKNPVTVPATEGTGVAGQGSEPEEPFYSLTLDIWQSAWKEDFRIEKMGPLMEYLRRNNIKKINLNPGIPMFPEPEFQEKTARKLMIMFNGFRSAGIEKINFLYAEKNYSIKRYLDFLLKYPELGIDTLVDDSEFKDSAWDDFRNNVDEFSGEQIKYSAFITLEVLGNSGVSDDLRYWTMENVDYPIYMSYFGCTLESQQEILRPYLEFGDRIGKKKSVGIAILLGNKSVGREISCQYQLDELSLKNFLYELDRWASGYECYGGLVLETNQRFPRIDVCPPGNPL